MKTADKGKERYSAPSITAPSVNAHPRYLQHFFAAPIFHLTKINFFFQLKKLVNPRKINLKSGVFGDARELEEV